MKNIMQIILANYTIEKQDETEGIGERDRNVIRDKKLKRKNERERK